MVNTAFHHVLLAVSWGSCHVRTLLPRTWATVLPAVKLQDATLLAEAATTRRSWSSISPTFSRGCFIFQKQQSRQLALGRNQTPQGRVSVIAWRYPLITFNFLSSLEGNPQTGGSGNKTIFSGEAKLLKVIMKMLKTFSLMLLGCIDLGTGPGCPHTSFRRWSKSQGSGGYRKVRLWRGGVWYLLSVLDIQLRASLSPCARLSGTELKTTPCWLHGAFRVFAFVSLMHWARPVDPPLGEPHYFCSRQCHRCPASDPDPVTDDVTRGKSLHSAGPHLLLCQARDKDTDYPKWAENVMLFCGITLAS